MIYSLRGELVYKNSMLAVIECAGVGYACRTTLSTLSELGDIGSEAKLFTYMSVREDCVELFGFSQIQELECFKLLITVSGVGPKAALAILSDITAEKVIFLISSEDSSAFTKVKGIGAKTAKRIVMELKDKITGFNISGSSINTQKNSSESHNTGDISSVSEAVMALSALGYSNSEIMPVISDLDSSLSSSELIKLALKKIASGKFQ